MTQPQATGKAQPVTISGALAFAIVLMLIAQFATAYFAFRSYQANVAVCNEVTGNIYTAHACGQ
jgi:hypothetical protein